MIIDDKIMVVDTKFRHGPETESERGRWGRPEIFREDRGVNLYHGGSVLALHLITKTRPDQTAKLSG